MDLVKEVLVNVLSKGEIRVILPDFEVSELVKSECMQVLKQIKEILGDDSLSDFDCIERIVCVFENSGLRAGNRHDF